MDWFSRTWTWIDGKWLEGNPPIMGPRTHAAWLGSSVFDGARAFEGVTPDLAPHAQRVNDSAGVHGAEAHHARRRNRRPGASKGRSASAPKPALYIKPMYWAEADGPGAIVPDPDSTRFCLCLFEAPMPEPTGFSLTLSRFRRPTIETMPTDVKTGCALPEQRAGAARARSRAGSTMRSCSTCSATSPRPRPPTCSSSRTVS